MARRASATAVEQPKLGSVELRYDLRGNRCKPPPQSAQQCDPAQTTIRCRLTVEEEDLIRVDSWFDSVAAELAVVFRREQFSDGCQITVQPGPWEASGRRAAKPPYVVSLTGLPIATRNEGEVTAAISDVFRDAKQRRLNVPLAFVLEITIASGD